MKLSRISLFLVALSMSTAMFAQMDHKAAAAPPTEAQKSFTAIKALAGQWEGPVTLNPPMNGSDFAHIRVSMRVTSRGNALVHEMNEAGKPEDPAKYGPGRMEQDVIEMMDHLKIKRAHIHGYSMGGAITGQLLAHHPDRMITAAFGGSGIREVDPAWVAKVPKDVKGKDELEDQASKDLAASSNRDEKAFAAIRKALEGQPPLQIDLTNITTPILAINGEFDSPNAKTARMKRELQNFKNVVLPGKSHLTAIMAGYMPDEYLKTLVEFIDSHDE